MHKNAIRSRAFEPSVARNLIARVLTIYRLKRTQITALKHDRFVLWSLPPALCNLWLLLVLFCGCRGYQGRWKVPSVLYNMFETRPPPQIKVSIFKNNNCG